MTSQYTSLEFTGPRKSLFYFIVVLSALALFCAAVAIAADYLFERHLTQGNVVLELSTSSGTIAESLFGAGGLGSFGHLVTKACGVSWLLSACAWVYAFLSWREFMSGERTSSRHVFLGFYSAFVIEVIGILTWPTGADAITYASGLFQLFLTGYVCIPVIKELRNELPT